MVYTVMNGLAPPYLSEYFTERTDGHTTCGSDRLAGNPQNAHAWVFTHPPFTLVAFPDLSYRVLLNQVW